MSAWALCTSCFCGPRDDESEHWEVLELRRPKIDKASIQKVEGSERVLRGRLGQEISVVEGSGRKVTGATPAAQETDAITPAAQETDAITPAAQETDAITPVARET